MKKIFRNSALALAILACCSSALAGNDNSNGGCQGNCPTTGGGTITGGNVANNVNSNVSNEVRNTSSNVNANTNANNVSSRNENNVANSNNVRNENRNSNSQGQHQGQGQDQTQRQQNNSSNTNNVGATGSGNSTNVGGSSLSGSVTVGGDSVSFNSTSSYKEAAQAATAYAPQIPTVATSCRLYISLGGAGSSTSTTASASGGIPIGNDQTCLSGNALKMMSALNDADRKAGRSETFTQADFRSQICKIEGMSDTDGCKNPPAPAKSATNKTASDNVRFENLMVNLSGNGGIVDAVAAAPTYTDPIIRARLGLPPLK